MNYDENMFLTTTIKDLKAKIDEMFEKYDPSNFSFLYNSLGAVPLKSHPISDSLKF